MRASRVIATDPRDQQSRNAWTNRLRTVDYARRVEPRDCTIALFCSACRAEVVWHSRCSKACGSISVRPPPLIHRHDHLVVPGRAIQFMKQQPFASFIGILAGALLALQGAAHAQSA